MSIKRCFNINKYFAFAFMVFAVLSGVSENYSETDAIRSTASYLPYFIKINQLLTQNISKIKVQILVKKYNDFSSYVQGIINSNGASHNEWASFAIGLVVFVAFVANNIIEQNNIWRKAVF